MTRTLVRDDAIKLDADDVRIEKLEPLRCNDCECVATREVIIDFRGAGFSQGVGHFCATCAKEVVRRISKTL